jgi:hypothetical protein
MALLLFLFQPFSFVFEFVSLYCSNFIFSNVFISDVGVDWTVRAWGESDVGVDWTVRAWGERLLQVLKNVK